MKVLVTGAAGFIGSKLMYRLAERGDEVVGLDNLNDYYDVRLKYGRLAACGIRPGFSAGASVSGQASVSGPAAVSGQASVSRQASAGASSVAAGGASADASAGVPIGTGSFQPGVLVGSSKFPNCRFVLIGIDDKESLDRLFDEEHFDAVINMAAQSGVRYSIENPYAYLQSNLLGFLNVLEACRHHPVKHLVFASSSSVYGMEREVPYREDARADTPVSLYGAIKRADELMAHSYSKLYGLPATALRFFTVYGPWGRPDMSPMLFATAISKGEPIKVFNHGDMVRDFTYIDDIAEGTLRVLDHAPVASGGAVALVASGAPAAGGAAASGGAAAPGVAGSGAPAAGVSGASSGAPVASGGAVAPAGQVPFEVYNIGCSHPVKLLDFITELEKAMGRPAQKIMMPMQPGDVYQTNADTAKLEAAVGYRPRTQLPEGIAAFVDWFRSDLNPLK